MLSKTVSFLIAALFSFTGSSAIASDVQQGTTQKWQPQTPKVKKEIRKQHQYKEKAKESPKMQKKIHQPKHLQVPADRQMDKRIGPSSGGIP